MHAAIKKPKPQPLAKSKFIARALWQPVKQQKRRAVFLLSMGTLALYLFWFCLTAFGTGAYIAIASSFDTACPSHFAIGSLDHDNCIVTHRVRKELIVIKSHRKEQEKLIETKLAREFKTKPDTKTNISPTSIAILITALKQDAPAVKRAELDTILKETYQLEHLLEFEQKKKYQEHDNPYSPALDIFLLAFIALFFAIPISLAFCTNASQSFINNLIRAFNHSKFDWAQTRNKQWAKNLQDTKDTWTIAELKWLGKQHDKNNLVEVLKHIPHAEKELVTQLAILASKYVEMAGGGGSAVGPAATGEQLQAAREDMLAFAARNIPYPPRLIRGAFHGKVSLTCPQASFAVKPVKRLANPLGTTRK